MNKYQSFLYVIITIMKKFLLLFPPFWIINSPHISVPIISASLKNAGYSVNSKDLNIEFINEVCTKGFTEKILKKIDLEWNEFLNNKEVFSKDSNKYQDKILSARYEELKNFYENQYEYYKDIPSNIENTIKMIRENSYEESSLEYQQAVATIYKALYLVKLYYSTFSEQLPYQMLNFQDIKSFILDEKHNLFLNFYKNKIKDIANDFDCIGISIGTEYQLIAGLTLAYLLKKQTNVNVFIGGNHISRISENIQKYPEFFDIFADSVLYGKSEDTIIKYAQYINEKIDIENVPDVIYKKNNSVSINKNCKCSERQSIIRPDYSDYDLQKYITNVPQLPLQIQTSCYWNKCSFCDFSYGSKYSVRKLEDVIDELKYNKLKYNVSKYYIVDEAIPPKIVEKLSDLILKHNLDVDFSIYGRLEKDFNKKILEKACKAGISNIIWGVESANKRVAKLINKGIDLKTMEKVLKLSYEAKIKNSVFVMLNFPTGTYMETLDTVNFLNKNKKFINYICISEFGLGRYCKVANNPKKYGVIIDEEQKDFSHALAYKTKQLNQQEKQMIYDKINEIRKELVY